MLLAPLFVLPLLLIVTAALGTDAASAVGGPSSGPSLAWQMNAVNYSFSEASSLPAYNAFVALQTHPATNFVLIDGDSGAVQKEYGSLGLNSSTTPFYFYWAVESPRPTHNDGLPDAFIVVADNSSASAVFTTANTASPLWQSECSVSSRPAHSLTASVMVLAMACGSTQVVAAIATNATAMSSSALWNVSVPTYATTVEVVPTASGVLVSAVGPSDAWLALVDEAAGTVVWNRTLSWPYFVTQSRPWVDQVAGMAYTVQGLGSIQGFYTEALYAYDIGTGLKRQKVPIVVGETCKIVPQFKPSSSGAVLACYHQNTDSPAHFRIVRLVTSTTRSHELDADVNATFTVTLDNGGAQFQGAAALNEAGSVLTLALAGPAYIVQFDMTARGAVLGRVHAGIEGGPATTIPFTSSKLDTVVVLQHWKEEESQWVVRAYGVGSSVSYR